MLRVEEFEEGAWIEHEEKRCPNPECGAITWFACDFQRFGRHQVRVCVPCHGVYLDGKLLVKLSDPPLDDAA